MSPLTTQLALPASLSAGPAALASAFALPHHVSAPAPPSNLISNGSSNSNGSLLTFLEDAWHANGIAGEGNLALSVNPLGAGQAGDTSLAVHYPAGTRDGAQFRMNLFPSSAEPVQTAILSYEVAFDPNFHWVKGGKLPGLYGESANASSICTGGNHESNCFSARLMWRNGGEGEVYAYIPSYTGFCSQSDVMCNQEYGTSLSRGTFSWTRITQLVSLNNPGLANGVLVLYANDTLALAQTGLVYRTRSSVALTSVLFSTFFGGSSDSYDSKGDSAYFRNFQVWYGPFESNTTGPAVNASFSSTDSSSSAEPFSKTPFYGPRGLFLLLLLSASACAALV
ncbi:hypothetical protein JCM8202v2_005213 [Rhodotorula sphaerocarpa]